MNDLGAGQSRVVTGTVPGGFSIDRPFDDWLVPGETMVAAQPSVGRKLIVGNRFEGTSVVQASRCLALNRSLILVHASLADAHSGLATRYWEFTRTTRSFDATPGPGSEGSC